MTESETVMVLGHAVPYREKMTVRETFRLERMLSQAVSEGQGQTWQDMRAAEILVRIRLDEILKEPKRASAEVYEDLNEAVAILLAPFEAEQLALHRERAKPLEKPEGGSLNLAGFDVPVIESIEDTAWHEGVDLEQLSKTALRDGLGSLEQNLKTAAILVKYRTSKTFKWPELDAPMAQAKHELDANVRQLMLPFFAAQTKRLVRKTLRRTAAQSPHYREALEDLGKELGVS